MKKETSKISTIQLTKMKKNLITIGCICLMLSIACFGLSLSVIQGPILEKMNAMDYFSILTILSSLGLAIFTPIGGKLGDLFGRRNIIIISGIITAVCGIGMGLVKSIIPFMILRLLLGAAQGAYTAAPYILMNEINDPEDVPKGMGLLSSSVAIGGFGGSILAGILADAGLLEIGITFPVIPLLIGIVLIAYNLPNNKQEKKVIIDFHGIIILSIFLNALMLTLNYAPKIGWSNPIILLGFAVSIILLLILIRVENKAHEPLIPIRLFFNKKYCILLLVGIIAYFYRDPMNIYAPLAVQEVMKKSTTISGSLQFPRTILTMILPIIVGAWVSKKNNNTKKAMILSTAIVSFSFLFMVFTNSNTPIIIYFVSLSLTGIAESFRAVSITPAAQATLNSSDLGIGTSLITFMNSLANLFSAAICGVVFDANKNNIQTGINMVFLITAIISAIGALIVILGVKNKSLN